jgi:hypothetical protein
MLKKALNLLLEMPACQKTNGLKSSDQSPNVIFELPPAQVFQIEPQASGVVFV